MIMYNNASLSCHRYMPFCVLSMLFCVGAPRVAVQNLINPTICKLQHFSPNDRHYKNKSKTHAYKKSMSLTQDQNHPDNLSKKSMLDFSPSCSGSRWSLQFALPRINAYTLSINAICCYSVLMQFDST